MTVLVVALQFAVSTAIIVYIVHTFDFSFATVALSGTSVLWFGLVLAVLAGQVIVNAYRWLRLALWSGAASIRLGTLVIIICAANLYSQVLPTGLGFDVVRGVMLSRLTGAGIATRSVVLDTAVGLLFLLGAVVLACWPLYLRTGATWTSLSLGGASLSILIFIVVISSAAQSGFVQRWAGDRFLPVSKAFGSLSALASTGGPALAVALCSMANVLAPVLLIYCIALGIGVHLAFLDCLLIVPCALLVASLPISFSGWGVREGSMVAGFALVGGKADQIVMVSLLYGLTAPLLGSLYYVNALRGLVSRLLGRDRTASGG